MAKYESDVKQVAAPVNAVYEKLSNLENLRPVIDMALNNDALKEKLRQEGQDPEKLEMLRNVTLTPDRITMPTGMIGDVALAIIEREENKTIKFETEQSPVDANLWIQVLPTGPYTSKMRLTLKADLNPMIKMMVGSKLKEGLEGLAEMLSRLPY